MRRILVVWLGLCCQLSYGQDTFDVRLLRDLEQRGVQNLLGVERSDVKVVGVTKSLDDLVFEYRDSNNNLIPVLVRANQVSCAGDYYALTSPLSSDTLKPEDGLDLRIPGPGGSDLTSEPTAASSAPTEGLLIAVIDSGISTRSPAWKRVAPSCDKSWCPGRPTTSHGSVVASAILEGASGTGVQLLDLNVFGGGMHGDDPSCYTTGRVAQAIHRAVDQKAAVINVSLHVPLTKAVRDALEHAVGSGVVVVVAAGNHSVAIPNSDFLSCHPRVISIMALDKNGRRAFFSNWFTNRVSCLAVIGDRVPLKVFDVIGYYSGTSVSAALFSGALARRSDLRVSRNAPTEQSMRAYEAELAQDFAHLRDCFPPERWVHPAAGLTSDLFAGQSTDIEARLFYSNGYDANPSRLRRTAIGRSGAAFQATDLTLRWRPTSSGVGNSFGLEANARSVVFSDLADADRESLGLGTFWYQESERLRFGVQSHSRLALEQESTGEYTHTALPFGSVRWSDFELLAYGRLGYTHDSGSIEPRALGTEGASRGGGLSLTIPVRRPCSAAGSGWGWLYVGAEGMRTDTTGDEYDGITVLGFAGLQARPCRSVLFTLDAAWFWTRYDDASFLLPDSSTRRDHGVAALASLTWMPPARATGNDEIRVSLNLGYDCVESDVPQYDAGSWWSSWIGFEYRFGVGNRGRGQLPTEVREEYGVFGHNTQGIQDRGRRPPRGSVKKSGG
ncbi:MAG: S8/S53 family peptidase [Planctomycetota bacterium]